MAESGENGSLPPVSAGGTAVTSDEAGGNTQCQVSLLNGDCEIPENTPGSQVVVEPANTSGDARSELPRRSSIIKVSTGG